MADTPKHSVSVAGIVVDDQDRVLIIKRRDNGQWEPPGGVLELDETPEQGVQREVFEETGLDVQVVRLCGVYKNMTKSVLALVFRCAPRSSELSLSSESAAVQWLPLQAACDLMDPAYAVRVRDCFEAQVPVRVHDGINLGATA